MFDKFSRFLNLFGKQIITGITIGSFFAFSLFLATLVNSGDFNIKLPTDLNLLKNNSTILSPETNNENRVLGEETTVGEKIESPLPDFIPELVSDQKNTVPKTVIGFLPFWTIKEATINYGLVDRIEYFGLQVSKDGNFVNLLPDKTEEPGFTNLKSDKFKDLLENAKTNGVKIDLVLRLMKNDDIEALVNSPISRKNLIKNTVNILNEHNLDGVNVDFEYTGTPKVETVKNFTNLLKEFKTEFIKLGKKDDWVLSFDCYADSVKKVRLYDIEALSEYTDLIIIMAYDFNRPQSFTAGPVAPLFGKEIYDYDVATTVFDFLKFAPPEKIILGVPWYGYDWPTIDSKPNSKTLPGNDTYGYASLSTIKKTKELIKDKNLTVKWDEYGKSPFVTYFDQKTKVWNQIYFEDEKSLALKYMLVNEANLKGIAIWALGYEGNYDSIWQVVKEKLK